MIKDNKFTETSLEELYKLRGELSEKENHLQILNTWYNNERDDKSRKGILKDIKSVELKIKEIKNKMANIKNKTHLKDSMDMLKLMGWTTDADPFGVVYREGDFKIKYNQKEDSYELYFNSIYYNTYHTLGQAKQEIEKYKERKKLRGKDSCGEKVYTKGESTDECKDDDATEMGSFEQLGQNHETEAMEPEEHPVLAQDGYNFEDPKVIEAAIKKVEASGHPDKDYLAGLKRALELAKKERAQKDSMISEVLNPLKESWSKIKELSTEDAIPTDWDVGLFDGKWYITRNGRKVKGPFSSMKAAENYLENSKMYLEDVNTKDSARLIESMRILQLSGLTTDADEQWITMNGAHVKIEGGESKASAAKKFIKSKGGNPAPKKESSKQETQKETSSPDLSEEEINKVKEKFSGKNKEKAVGSEYGDYADLLTQKYKEAGKYPNMKKYDEISDKMWNMRKEGKKDTPEYKALEKERKEWNKSLNKVEKEIKQKAYNLSSPEEKERLDEIRSYFKKNPAPKWAN